MRWIALLPVAALAACASEPVDQVAEARPIVLPIVSQIVAKEYPTLYTISPAAECITDNATEEETVALVRTALQGVSGRETQMVLAIARRPETRACFAEKGVNL